MAKMTLLPQQKSKQNVDAKGAPKARVTGLPARTSSGKGQLFGGGDKLKLAQGKKK